VGFKIGDGNINGLRMSEVVHEDTRLEERVLEDLLFFIDLFEIRCYSVLVRIWRDTIFVLAMQLLVPL
jgi:predicted component of type VI protein secretion system